MDSKGIYSLGIVYQLGISIVIPLIICIGGGIWLDDRFGTSPRFVFGGIVVGLYVAVIDVIYILKPLLGKSGKDSKIDSKK